MTAKLMEKMGDYLGRKVEIVQVGSRPLTGEILTVGVLTEVGEDYLILEADPSYEEYESVKNCECNLIVMAEHIIKIRVPKPSNKSKA